MPDVLIAADENPIVVEAGWTALLLVVLMGVALAALMWSFARRVKRIKTDPFDGDRDADDESPRGPDRG